MVTMIGLMRATTDRPALQLLGLSALERCVEDMGALAVEPFAAHEGTDWLLKSMSTNPDHPDIQECSCRCIALVTCFLGDQIAAKIVNQHGLELVLQAMQRHKNVVPVQKFASVAIRNLCTQNDAHKTAARMLGAIEALFDAITLHKSDADVQEHAFWALSVIGANNPENLTKISSHPVIELAIAAMRTFPANADLQAATCNVFLNAIVGDVKKTQDYMNKAGALEAVITAMKMHRKDPQVQFFTCGAIRNSVADHAENQALVGKLKGVQRLLRVLATFYDAKLQVVACSALTCLCCYPENQAMFVKKGGLSLLTDIMMDKFEDAEVLLAIGQVLQVLTWQNGGSAKN